MSRASEKAYQTIRELIISGELAPGDFLGEEALAERVGVSRTPVREALRRLEADMLVRRTDTKRSFVADWSLDDIEDVFELRAMLEAHAARRAARRIDQKGLKRLKNCNDQLHSAIARTPADIEEFLRQNREFHAIILEIANSRRLTMLLSTLIEQPVIWRTAHHYDSTELQRSHAEHEELLSAFERRDPAWAEAIMGGHIRRAFHVYADAHRALAKAEESKAA